ncbi:hypothetical protein EDC18_101133 [Natranaerovirga pectinivora]|uniref:Uncharacterized protein n=1 Tax=Natranaerovirga pectinivora TaxID=682400 RepID=A0A4R3MNK4_9FIRM|nr:hypothetical protein [Natranaerovirga pectinivora]TCT16837.1 hypothetical protein EDC18_101133 [Natranaerovirga pectinivora]
MENKNFDRLLEDYRNASVEDKIDMYCSTTDLSEEQYMVLLRNFPRSEMKKLERALS